jgi:GNAT superfamily N-acetyltransferase
LTPVLRPAVPADASRVAEVFLQARAAFMPYAPPAHADEEVRAWVRDQLLPAGGTTIAEVLGRIVGFVSVSRGPSHGWIDQMYVEPRFVGQRIGTALLAHALTGMARPVRLHVFQANTGARRFYERHGFVPIEFSDGADNEERCPDVLYELPALDAFERVGS